MDEFAELRCNSCGGPLEGSGDVLKCMSCGRSQLKVDSQKYIEQAKMEMMAWISKTIPAGVNLDQTEMMDPIARHNIFMTSIRPALEANYREYKFGFVSAMSNQLLVMPFKTLSSRPSRYSPKSLFEFDAKVKSIKALAVDDDSRQLVDQASGVSTAYAMSVNSMDLMMKDDLERYQFMANNFKASAEALAGVEGYNLPCKRFEALSKACDGINDIMANRSMMAVPKLEDATYMLEELEKEARSNIDYSSMALAISREVIVCKSVTRIARSLTLATNVDVQNIFKTISDLMIEVDTENSMGHGNLPSFSRVERTSEVLTQMSEILATKAGDSTIRIVPGPGQILMPFWPVEIRYSFITGTLFKKHSVEVTELILVSAMFPTSSNTVSNPRSAITDIFKAMPETTFMQRIKGDETSITMGGKIREVYDNAHHSRVRMSTKVVIPVSTKADVEMIVNSYLNECKTTHTKLQMGRASIQNLIYIPFDYNANGLMMSVNLGNLAPKAIGDREIILKLTL